MVEGSAPARDAIRDHRTGPTWRMDVSVLLLIVLILVIAAAGGFLGTLLEVAGWLLLLFILVGAGVGFLLWQWLRSFLSGSRL